MGKERKSKAELLQEIETLRRHISKLEGAEQMLKSFEKQFTELFENTPVGIYRTTPDGRIIMANPALIKMLGYSNFEELSQRNLEKEGFAPGYPRSAFKDLIKKQGEVVGLESAWKRRDGTLLFVIENARAVRDDSGKILYYEGIVQDITERKKVEQALIKSHEYANSLLDAAPESIAITDLNGRIQQVNNAFEKNSGRKRKELIGKTLLELGIMPEDEFQKIKSEIIPRLMKEDYIQDFESVATQRDGTKNHILISLTLLKNAEGKPIGVITMGRDITERKKMEQTLRENEEKYRSLVEEMKDVIYTLDTEGNVTSVNKAGKATFGREPEEVLGKSFKQWIPKENLPAAMAAFKRILGGEKITAETVMLDKNGKPHNVEFSSTALIKDGKVVGTRGILRDITERKKAEQKIRESEEKYRQVVSTTMDVIMIFDAETRRFVEVNKACEELYGYSREEFLNLKQSDITAEPEKTNESIEQTLEGKLLKIPIRYHRKKDGMVFPVEISAGTFELKGRKVLCGVIRDITERRKAEEQIRKLSSAVEQSIDGIAIADLEARFMYVNKAFARMHEFSPEEMIGMPVAKLHNEEQMDQFKFGLNQIKTRGFKESEIGHIKKDGTPFPTFVSVTLLKDSDGQPIGMLAVTKDITERKKAEELLRKTRERLEYILATSPATTYTCKVGGDWPATFMSENVRDQFGYEPHQFIEDTNFWSAHIHPDDRQRVFDELSHLIESDFHVHEYRFLHKDGSYRWAHDELRLIRDKQGKPLECIGYWTDITERKKAEQELREYREKMAQAERLASLGTLSATTAHELNQPLMVISLSIENALEELKGPSKMGLIQSRASTWSCPQSVIEDLKDALLGVSHAVSIINGFRDYARKSTNKITKEINLKTIAERTIRLLGENARRAKITLNLKGMDKLPNIFAVEEDMEQLFFSLTENAIQAADRKKEHNLVISGAVKDRHIELKFSDDCGGIAPEDVDRIFEPFFTTKTSGKAMGMGLCVVEHIVSRAGGQISVESKLGKGTTFCVTLPLNK